MDQKGLKIDKKKGLKIEKNLQNSTWQAAIIHTSSQWERKWSEYGMTQMKNRKPVELRGKMLTPPRGLCAPPAHHK